MAAVSVLTAALVYRYAVDPRHVHHHPSVHGAAASPAGGDVEAAKARGGGAPAQLSRQQVWRDVKSVLAIRSFQLIVLQASTRTVARIVFERTRLVIGVSRHQSA